MCKPDQQQHKATLKAQNEPLLLLTTSSFGAKTKKDDDDDKQQLWRPSKKSTHATLVFMIVSLFIVERLCRLIISNYQNIHPVLEIEVNRMILARHFAVDFLSCSSFALIGVLNINKCRDLVFLNRMPRSGYEDRLFTYIPASHQISLLFLAYNIKNTFDSIIWRDGPEFIFHHILSGVTAWGAMYPGFGHFYVIFFMGLSELSTLFLCLLANFDDDYGVKGLGEAFPIVRIMLGAAFVIAFVICRTIIWPFSSYYFITDVLQALKDEHVLCQGRKVWMKTFVITCFFLSILQVVWLGQIFTMGKTEIEKLL